MSIFIFDKPNLNYVRDIFKNDKVKKIVNVYQQQYVNSSSQGFGDFLRGSIYLSYLCDILEIKFDIDLNNHPMSSYLSPSSNVYNIPYSLVKAYVNYDAPTPDSERKFLKELFLDINNFDGDTFFLFNNSIALFEIQNPKFNIIQKARKIIIPKIKPSDYLINILNNKLKMFDLLPNEYAIIHIRCGDYCMNIKHNHDSEKHIISSKHLNDIISQIKTYANKNKKYILIGDSKHFKEQIKKQITFLYHFNNEICHTGYKTNTHKSVVDTLIDFYLMKNSKYIISFSAYGHGSGFSKHCSEIFNIPFKQILLEPILTYNV